MLRGIIFCVAVVVASQAGRADSLANCLNFDVRPDETSIVACTQFIEQTPQHPQLAQAHRTRGFALELGRQFDKAIADYTRAIELDPSKNDYFFRRGVTYQKRGDLELAAADFRKAISLWPEDEHAKKRLDQLSSQQPQDCVEGADVAITGTIASIEDGFLDVQQTNKGCKISGVGASEVPSTCIEGAGITASGVVDEEGTLTDLVNVACQ